MPRQFRSRVLTEREAVNDQAMIMPPASMRATRSVDRRFACALQRGAPAFCFGGCSRLVPSARADRLKRPGDTSAKNSHPAAGVSAEHATPSAGIAAEAVATSSNSRTTAQASAARSLRTRCGAH